MTPAMLYTDLADGPNSASAWWAEAMDGTRLRIVAWDAGRDGTVLIFPGRNEHAEKYGRVAAELARFGYASAVVDWRGQGLSDRSQGAEDTGHVDDFADYQKDVAALLDTVRTAGFPEPYYLLAHSMGGAIGLRAIAEGLPVRASAFSAPMWGIVMPAWQRPVARGVSAVSRIAGFSKATVPVGPRDSYLLVTPFDDNALTTDPDTFAWMASHARHDPRLALGRPTMSWLHHALAEIRRLHAMPKPGIPAYVGIAEDDVIVDNRAIRLLASAWPGLVFEEYPDARHELMMERAETRMRFFSAVRDLFQAA